MANRIIEQTAVGQLRGERAGGELRAAYYWLRPGHFLESAFVEAVSLKSRAEANSFGNFVTRSTLNETSTDTPSTKKQKTVLTPSDAEFAKIDKEMTEAHKQWQITPLDWRCPCCDRSKREFCRKSKVGKWTARIYAHAEYVEETDHHSIGFREGLYPSFPSDPIIGNVLPLALCQDCYLIITQVKTRRPDIANVYLDIEDLRASILVIGANVNHERDLSIAESRAVSNSSRAEAELAFNEHRRISLAALSHYRIGRRHGFDDGIARAHSAIKLEEENKLSEDLSPYIDWLIGEGTRLSWREVEVE